jgi:DNA repair protein RadC
MVYQKVTDCEIEHASPIRRPRDIFDLLENYRDAPKEYFLLVTLNNNYKPIGIYIVSIGTVNRTVVHPREVFRNAISDLSSFVVLAHNHPSGEVEPSSEDNDMTELLYEASKIIGINILDHVIISKDKYYSFKMESDILNYNETSEKTTGEINYGKKRKTKSQ